MRPIHLAQLDKIRPVLVLTRQAVLPFLTSVTVAPITSSVHPGLSTQLPVGPDNGLDHASAVSLDNIQTIPATSLLRHVGYLLPREEAGLTAAIHSALALGDV